MAVGASVELCTFRNLISRAKRICIMTGTGLSMESGISVLPRWRKYATASLTVAHTFYNNPCLVWEYYNHERKMASRAEPNAAHITIAEFQEKHEGNKTITIVTQAVDGLHLRAGTKRVIELHGNLFKTKCCRCEVIDDYPVKPISEVKNTSDESSSPGVWNLPRCEVAGCGGLLRPYVLWTGEKYEPHLFRAADEALKSCEILMVIGTSCVTYPASVYAPQVAARWDTVAEFSTERNRSHPNFQFHFSGQYSDTVPTVLEYDDDECCDE